MKLQVSMIWQSLSRELHCKNEIDTLVRKVIDVYGTLRKISRINSEADSVKAICFFFCEI